MKPPHRRSWLVVPAHQEAWYPRLERYEADALVIDFEDGVPEGMKSMARAVFAAQADKVPALKSKHIFLRVNGIETPHFEKDIEVLMALEKHGCIDGVVLPKVCSPQDIQNLESRLGKRKMEIVPILEVLEGERYVLEILNASRQIRCVHFAESGDYGLEFGIFDRHLDASKDLLAADFAAHVLKAGHMTGKVVIDGAYLEIQDLKGLEQRCRWASRMGFEGKIALHPSQIAMINQSMPPLPEDIEKAREIVRVYEGSPDSQAFLRHGGSFITPPKYEAAKRYLKKYVNSR